MPREQHIEPQYCPLCHGVLAASVNLGDEREIEPGDYAICQYCAGFLIFDEKMKVSAVSDDTVRSNKRLSPASINMMFEAQKAIRGKAQLLTIQENGVVQAVQALPPNPIHEREREHTKN